MKIILNEKQILDKAINEKKIYDKPMVTIRLLIKYYFSIGQKKRQVYDSVNSFLKENMHLYAEAKWQKNIDKAIVDINKSKKFDMFVVNKVTIFKDEMDKIKTIDNFRLEKLAFTLLVYSKIYNQMNCNSTNWVNAPLKDIFKDAKITVKKADQDIMIHKLKNLELVHIPKKVDCINIKLLYAYDNGEVAFEISDFRDFVLNYDRYFNTDKYGYCKNCNKIMKVNNNKQKYCDECAKEIWYQNHKDVARESYHRRKNKDFD